MRLQPAESDAIDRRIADVEARTGVQVVVAVVPRSDDYLELPRGRLARSVRHWRR